MQLSLTPSLQCFPGHAGADTVPLDKVVHGYYLKDEPHMYDFGQWSADAKAIRKKRPGALVFINMLGSDRTTYEGEDIVPMRGWWGCMPTKKGTPGSPCSYKKVRRLLLDQRCYRRRCCC